MNVFIIESIIILLLLNLINKEKKKVIKKQQKIIDIFIVVIFSLFITTKNEEVKDVIPYLEAFNNSGKWIENLSTINIFNKIHSFEYGYLLICNFFRFVFRDIHFMYFFISLFNVILTPFFLSKIIKNEESASSIRMIYVNWFGILYCGIALRAGIAITFGLGFIYFLSRRKYILSILCLFIGFLIQRSILLFVLFGILYLFFNDNCSKKNRIVFFTIALIELILILFNFGAKYSLKFNYFIYKILNFVNLNTYYVSYVENVSFNGIGITKLLTFLALLYIVIIIYLYNFDIKKYLCYITIFAMTCITIFVNVTALSRIYDMALMFSIPIMYEIKNRSVEKNKNNNLLICSYYIIYLFFVIIQFKTCFF